MIGTSTGWKLEASLLGRMAGELVADGADLESAERDARARLWVLDAVLAELGDPNATARLGRERLDSLQRTPRLDSLRASAGRAPHQLPDLVEAPLAALGFLPNFDLSSDAYQEMVATGSIRIVRDAELRSSILLYYRVARDQAGNEAIAGGYQDRLEDALASIGVAVGDDLTLPEIAARARTSPTFAVGVRRAQNRIRRQTFYYSVIETARLDLEAALSP